MKLPHVCICFGPLLSLLVQAARPHEHTDDAMMMEFMGLDQLPEPDDYVAWALLQGGGPESLPFAEEALKKAQLANVLLEWKLQRIERALNDCPDAKQGEQKGVLGQLNDFQRKAVATCTSALTPQEANCDTCMNHYEGTGGDTHNKDVDPEARCVFVIPQNKCAKFANAKEGANHNESDAENPPDLWVPFLTDSDCPRIAEGENISKAGVIGQVRELARESGTVVSVTKAVYDEQLKNSTAHDNHGTHMVAVGAIKNITMHLADLMKSENAIVGKLKELKTTLESSTHDECKTIGSAVDKAITYVKTYGKVVWVKSGKDILEHVVKNLQKMKEIQLAEEQKEKDEKEKKKAAK